VVWLAYVISIVIVAIAWRSQATSRRGHWLRGIVYAIVAILAIVVLATGINVIHRHPNPRDAILGYVLVLLAASGYTLYVVGLATSARRTADMLRTIGWSLVVVAFATPSTLTLALPLVAVLAFDVPPPASARAAVDAR